MNPVIFNACNKSVSNIVKNKDIIIQAAAITSGSKDIINRPHIHIADNAIMNSLLLREKSGFFFKGFFFVIIQ